MEFHLLHLEADQLKTELAEMEFVQTKEVDLLVDDLDSLFVEIPWPVFDVVLFLLTL